MSWEYDPEGKYPEYEQRQRDLDMLRKTALDIVGDPDKVLSDYTLFGINLDTDDVETLRILLAYMLVYKDMK